MRVDNLMQGSDIANNDKSVSRSKETQNCPTEQDVSTMPNMKNTTRFSSQANTKRQQQASKTSNAIVQEEDDKILDKETSGAAAREGARSSSSATTTTESGKRNSPEEKTSSDEGLGSGGSSSCGSAQSSTAGSHCDDRETPPHIDATASPASASSPTGGSSSQSNSQKCPFPCDNKNELSLDSLNRSENHEFPANGYCTDSSSSVYAKKKRDKSQASRKSRTLTWSASLGSIGATLKFGAGMSSSSKSKSRSETNLKVEESSSEAKCQSQLDVNDHADHHAIDAHTDLEDVCEASIVYHTDCFTCTTCNELLVDLRALIYVNDFPLPPVSLSSHQKQQQQQVKSHLPDAEYVNIPNNSNNQAIDNHHEALRHDDETNKQQQISLYCHRHFVELFKPRCQQCDCLILDEECTEAEGKCP